MISCVLLELKKLNPTGINYRTLEAGCDESKTAGDILVLYSYLSSVQPVPEPIKDEYIERLRPSLTGHVRNATTIIFRSLSTL